MNLLNGLVQVADGVATFGFSAEQITSITNSINSAISNVLSMFVALLPVFATICGVGFGINFVRGLFNKVKKNK